MLTQLDDLMVKDLWWHMPVNPITRWRLNTTYMEWSASYLFGQFFHFGVICVVAHLFWLPFTSP
jgi:hypothetical protein